MENEDHMEAKKKPLREIKQVEAHGTTYTAILHGRSRKRVIVSYMYWDCTGGLKGWEDCDIFDRTYQTEDEARNVFKHYQIPENLIARRSKVESHWC